VTALIPLTTAQVLQVGHWFEREGRLFQIVAWNLQQPLVLQARAADTGDTLAFALTELFAAQPLTRFAPTEAELQAANSTASSSTSETTGTSAIVDAATLPAHLLCRADQIIQIVETVQAQMEQVKRHCQRTAQPFVLTEATRQACQALPSPVSLSSYYIYRQIYQTHQGNRALIAASLRRCTYGKTRIDPNAQHFIDTLIRRFYRSNPPLRAQTVYEVARQLWAHNRHWWLNVRQVGESDHQELLERLLNGHQEIDLLLTDPAHSPKLTQVALPSRSWFYGYVRWFTAQPGDARQVYITRHGQADWEANFMLFDRFTQTATLPLQSVFADHYRLDVLHVDDTFREVLGRLWLTLLIDAFSRAVLGLFLAYEAPNIDSIQGALRHAIWPKNSLTDWGIDLPWACYGIPQQLFLDNAWAHHSYSLEDLVRALAAGGRYTQMALVFRPPYQARYGGLIERLFGNLSGQLRERLPGAVLHPNQRHWHNASQGACLLYADIRRILHQMIVDYMHTPHRDLNGQTPHDRWLVGLRLMTPLPPPFTPHLERCFWRLHPETRTATQMGLALFGLHYWEAGLAGLRAPDRQGRPRHFHLRYDPADVSRVAVFEQGLWLGDAYARELRLPDGHYEPVSLWELELAKDLARQTTSQQSPRPHSWLIHLLEARELVTQRQAEQKLIRRKIQQLRERQRGRPPTTTPAQRRSLEAAQLRQTEQAMTATMNTPTMQDHDPRNHLLETLDEVL
jgi:hypothetical protein